MKIYRGENILNGKKEKVHSIKSLSKWGFPSDFINGGNPYRIAELGIFDATVLHVAKNFSATGKCSKKHFISFSKNKSKAEEYASHHWNGTEYVSNGYDILDDYYTENLNEADRDIWESTQHLIVELNIADRQPIQAGINFLNILTYNEGRNKVFLLDVVEYLLFQRQRLEGASAELLSQYPNVIPDIDTALENARRDEEWLVLSLDPVRNNPGDEATHSGLIANGAIFELQHYVDSDWFAG